MEFQPWFLSRSGSLCARNPAKLPPVIHITSREHSLRVQLYRREFMCYYLVPVHKVPCGNSGPERGQYRYSTVLPDMKLIPSHNFRPRNADSGQIYTSCFKNRPFTNVFGVNEVNYLFLKNKVYICPESAFRGLKLGWTTSFLGTTRVLYSTRAH